MFFSNMTKNEENEVRDGAEMSRRCRGDVAEVSRRCRGDVAELVSGSFSASDVISAQFIFVFVQKH